MKILPEADISPESKCYNKKTLEKSVALKNCSLWSAHDQAQ